jgi:hypothetical protein
VRLPFVSRTAYDAVAEQLRVERQRVDRLTEEIFKLKRRGFEPAPEKKAPVATPDPETQALRRVERLHRDEFLVSAAAEARAAGASEADAMRHAELMFDELQASASYG